MRDLGGIRSANADISNDKRSEKLLRRKSKGFCARLIRADTLGFSAKKFFTSFIVTYVSIRTSDTSRIPHGYPFTGLQNVPLPLIKFENLINPQIRYVILAPLHLRRRNSIRPVSCYAIFKGWLLLSQPPGC